jgi:hypothetical protein
MNKNKSKKVVPLDESGEALAFLHELTFPFFEGGKLKPGFELPDLRRLSPDVALYFLSTGIAKGDLANEIFGLFHLVYGEPF